MVFSVLALASCGKTGDGGSPSSSEGTGSSDAVEDSGDQSTPDGSIDESVGGSTDNSTDGSTDESTGGSTGDSTVGSTDESTSIGGGGEDEKDETVTVQFRGNGAADTIFDGNKAVEIEKGATLDLSNIPTVTRVGYTFKYWAYDAKGNNQWSPADTFADDTILYACWQVDENASDTVTVYFTCMSGTYQSGDKEVTINTGSSISKAQFPVYTRKGYVISWSYDKFGEEPWNARDAFNKDTNLYATWIKEDQYFDVLNAYFYTIGSMQINGTISFKNYDITNTSVDKYDGQNYCGIAGSGDYQEEYWYVDGIFYSVYGGQKIKTELSYDEFLLKTGGYFVGPDRIFKVTKDMVTSITKDENVYTLIVDAEKYSAALGASTTYTKFEMTITMGDDGEVYSVAVDYTYLSNGMSLDCVSTDVFVGINETTVEIPENADEFIEK